MDIRTFAVSDAGGAMKCSSINGNPVFGSQKYSFGWRCAVIVRHAIMSKPRLFILIFFCLFTALKAVKRKKGGVAAVMRYRDGFGKNDNKARFYKGLREYFYGTEMTHHTDFYDHQ